MKKTSLALASLASSGVANAALVQITITGNQITSTMGNQLSADLTGDGIDDISIANAVGRTFTSTSTFGSGFTTTYTNHIARVRLDGYAASASYSGIAFISSASVPNGTVRGGPGVGAVTGGFAITFTDARYGANINAFVEVDALGASNIARVRINRVVFDDENLQGPAPTTAQVVGSNFAEATQIPEPSSLALLALGATGLAARRRRQVA